MQLIHKPHAKDVKWEQNTSQTDRYTLSENLADTTVYKHTLVFTYFKMLPIFPMMQAY